MSLFNLSAHFPLLSHVVSSFGVGDFTALIACWPAFALYSHLAGRHGAEADCLHGASRRSRMGWAVSLAERPISGRVVDAALLATLNNSAVFFASSALLALGAFLSLTVSPDRMRDALDAMGALGPKSAIDAPVFLVKTATACGLLGWAFLKFSWSMRQIAFACALSGAFGDPSTRPTPESSVAAFAELTSLASESFNAGLRAFYWSFASCCWLLSPWLCVFCSAALAFGLWRREFRSDTLRALCLAYPSPKSDTPESTESAAQTPPQSARIIDPPMPAIDLRLLDESKAPTDELSHATRAR